MDQNEHPAASRRGFLRSGGMAALFGVAAAPVAGAASVTLAVSPEFQRLLDAEQDAYDAFGRILGLHPWDSPVAREASDRWNDLMDACFEFPCATIGDFRRWAAFVLVRMEPHHIEDYWIKGLLRIQAGLPAEEEV